MEATIGDLKEKILSLRDYFEIVDDAVIICIRDKKINVIRARPNGLDFIITKLYNGKPDVEYAKEKFPHWNAEWISIERDEERD